MTLATKHLKLRPNSVRPVSNAPSHAANIAIQTADVGADACRLAGGYGWLDRAVRRKRPSDARRAKWKRYGIFEYPEKRLQHVENSQEHSRLVDCLAKATGLSTSKGPKKETISWRPCHKKSSNCLVNGPASKKLWKDKGELPAFYRDMLTLTDSRSRDGGRD
jgi:hypothetical protein